MLWSTFPALWESRAVVELLARPRKLCKSDLFGELDLHDIQAFL